VSPLPPGLKPGLRVVISSTGKCAHQVGFLTQPWIKAKLLEASTKTRCTPPYSSFSAGEPTRWKTECLFASPGVTPGGKALLPGPPFRPCLEQGSSAQYDLQLSSLASSGRLPTLSVPYLPSPAALHGLRRGGWTENLHWNAFPRTSSPDRSTFARDLLWKNLVELPESLIRAGRPGC
jgi:hypothetical protein